MLWLGFDLLQFVEAVRSGGQLPVRPAGIDGFLPVSGLLGTVFWVKGGGINSVHPAAVILFLTIIAVSFLLRRSFCSWICPVGTLSESAWKCGFKFFRRNWRLPVWFDYILRSCKYLLLMFFLYSIAIAMPVDALDAFIHSDYHKIADVRLLDFFQHLSAVALGIILALLVLSVVLKNPVCRYLCPYGALLGLAATLSPTRVVRIRQRCVACGVCNQVCPSHLDIMHKTSIASPECIGCWRCVSHCRCSEALAVRVFRTVKLPGLVFAALVVALFLAGSVVGKMSGHWHSSIPMDEYIRLLRR